EQLRHGLGVGAAPAVAEREQPRPRVESRRQLPRARDQPLPLQRHQRPPQLDDLVRLAPGGLAQVGEDRLPVGRRRSEERIEALDPAGLTDRAHDSPSPARCSPRAPSRNSTSSPPYGTTAMASLACTSTTSPARASTSATLTSSGPASVSTSASPSPSSRTTRTGIASSEQVTQVSPEHGSVIAPPPARRRRARAPTARGTSSRAPP